MDAGPDIRATGIEMIGDVPWGTHFCQFYKTPQDLLDILVPYFKAGLEHNEYCMWVTSEPVQVRDAEAALRGAIPDLDAYLSKGSIEIILYTEWYLKGGYFDQKRVLNDWVEKTDQALARGYDGLRLSGNTFWLEDALWQDFTEYESAVNNVISKYRMIALCTYSLDKCGASEIIDVVKNHQFALVKRENHWMLIENSERKRAAEAIERLNEALEAANHELESFSYSVSHDLRAPLRAIDGFSQVLIEDYGDKFDAEGKRLLNILRESARKLQKLIEDILAFSRASRTALTASAIDMDALVRAAYEELSPARVGRSVQLTVHKLPPAYGDPAMIRQVVTNLLDNAIKFTRPRDTAQIEVGAQAGDRETVYYVKDNGVGFDMQYVEHLFGAFQRLHSAEQFEGSGIGLAIVKRIVTRHGGRVWAEGKVGAGATFYFALPLQG